MEIMEEKPEIIAANYCISFVDLLGQKAEYKGEGLLPIFESDEDRKRFLNKIRVTIKPIYILQKTASDFIEAALNYQSSLRQNLSPPLQNVYDHTHEVKLMQQRWSDGLVYFVSLLKDNIKCPTGAIFEIFGTVGCLCFLGLANRRPLRGSIDISWGVELHPGEIYGAAVANAYEFESKIAQYPRIVIGERTIEYLEVSTKNPETDVYAEFNRHLAKICLDMVAIDFDGNYIIDYLGSGFKENITKGMHDDLFKHAFKFVNEQLVCWHEEKNTKLSMRYNHLFSYFDAHKGIVEEDPAQPPSFTR